MQRRSGGKSTVPARRFNVAAVLLTAAACTAPAHESASPKGALPEGIVARVGTDELSAVMLRDVALAQGVSAQAALDALLQDRIAALSLVHRAPTLAAYLRRTVLARRLLEEYRTQAELQGPISDAELRRYSERHWQEMDRPVSSRVTHVVVQSGPQCDRALARRVAERLLQRLQPQMEPAVFRAAVTPIDSADCKQKVEDLDPVTSDGRTVARGEGHYVAAFAKAANEIPAIGQHSSVIETEFGFHVLLLTERLPALTLGEAERRARLWEEVRIGRAREQMRPLLEAAHATLVPEIVTEAMELTGLVQGAP